MPGALKGIAYLFPSTPGIHGFVRINTMGADLTGVRPEYQALWIQALVYWIGATFMHRWRVRNYATTSTDALSG
ncbi:MAG: ABC transporter permease [Rikenellaceae bacterium]|jgi:ABC-2 type transport system permease protein|nr:ABC transporter permease [Rikenellaceae bacterium]